MKYRSFVPLLLCGLVLMGFRANSQNQTPSKTPQPGRVSQDELNQLAKNLSGNGLQQYTYRVNTIDAKGVSKTDKPRIVRGLFMMRQPKFLKPLPNGFFNDGSGDLVYFGKINRDGKTNVDYALTFDASGDVIAAFDTNNDGLADGILGRDSVGTSWSLNNKSLGALQECFESRAFGEAVLCVRGPISTQPAGGRGRSGTRARRGTGTGSADEGDSLGAFIDDLSTSDCSTTPNPGMYVTDVKKEANDWEKIQVLAQAQADRARSDGQHMAVRQLEGASHSASLALEFFLASQDKTLSSTLREASHREYENAVYSYNTEISAARRHGANLGGLENRRPLPLNPDTRGSVREGTTRRPISPDGLNEDPRCQSQRTRLKQGLWFMSKEYCPDRNFVDCWARAQDAVSEGTDGGCHLEPGPAGGQMLVCTRPTDEQNEDATQPPPPKPEPDPTDHPHRFILSPGVKLNYTYISTTQLGAMLGVLCQRDDRCGGMGNIQKRQATPN